MMEGGLTPRELADFKIVLAGEYSFLSSQLEKILTRKPAIWNEMRKNHQSDKATEREYEATEDGINEMGLRMRLKSVEKLLSALSSSLRVAEGEARNLH